MFIECVNCKTKFDIDQNLIPEKGRLLQCNKCNHKWFFTNNSAIKKIQIPISEKLTFFENKKSQESDSLDSNNTSEIQTKISTPTERIVQKIKINKVKIRKTNNFLSLTIVFIISFIALIILTDTFKNPLGKIVPNLEFTLYNLYESIKDIILFVRDLI